MFSLWIVILMLSLNCVWSYPMEDEPQKNISRTPRRIELKYNDINACNCVCGASNREQRVVGGEEAHVHEFPWLAGLSMDGDFKCGASLITRRHVLTAAHCIPGFDIRKMRVVLADHDRNAPGRENEIVKRRVISARVHENFDAKTFNNDIAVLELDQAVEFSSIVQPACLPLNAETNYTSRTGIIAGWGKVEEQQPVSSVLKKLTVPVWSRKDCIDAGYQAKKITENMFCAGYPEGKRDACSGDSGGPLHITNEIGEMEIIGLVSWGRGCARPNFPGLYTKVNNYLDWISDSLNGECVCPPAKHSF